MLSRTMLRLKKRAEFLAVSRGMRAGRRAFSLQSGTSETTDPDVARVGFTVTKKVGTATERNRIRRRLREAVRALPDGALAAGRDFVLVGRREALGEPFRTLVADLRSALGQLRRQSDRNGGRRAGPGNPPDGGAGSAPDTILAETPNPSGDP